MDNDLKLPEGDINLDLDGLPDDFALPRTENAVEADFNLDDFLADDEPIETTPVLPQDEVDLDDLLDNDAPLVAAEPMVDEEDVAAVPEFVDLVDVEPIEDADPVEGQAEPDASFAVEEDFATEEKPVTTEPKGWAFDGLEEEALTEAELQAEVEPEFVAKAVEEIEPEPVFEAPLVEDAPSEKSGYDMVFESNYVAWYDGHRGEATFELDRESTSTVLQGDDARKVIHVNVGYDTYGWQVQFAGGVVMNLRDVREYQLRNGTLPDADGVIIYGEARTEFYNIEKITIYENVRYFTYAKK